MSAVRMQDECHGQISIQSIKIIIFGFYLLTKLAHDNTRYIALCEHDRAIAFRLKLSAIPSTELDQSSC